jgi:hypothetical protein
MCRLHNYHRIRRKSGVNATPGRVGEAAEGNRYQGKIVACGRDLW